MSPTRRAVLRAAATASALALAGCGGGGTTTQAPTPEPTPTATVTVTMFDSAFDPVDLSIDTQTEVVWKNEDGYAHTVTAASESWSFDVEVPPGETASYTFRSPGLYGVYCRFHGGSDLTGMSMEVLVADAAGGGG